MSVAYIGPTSRPERSRNTKIGIEVAHVTHFDSDTTFKVKSSKVNLQRWAYCGGLPLSLLRAFVDTALCYIGIIASFSSQSDTAGNTEAHSIKLAGGGRNSVSDVLLHPGSDSQTLRWNAATDAEIF